MLPKNMLHFIQKHKKKLIIIPLVLIAVLLLSSVIILNNKGIYDGIYIENVNVSGMSIEQAVSQLTEKCSASDNKNLILRYMDKEKIIPLNQISFRYLIDESAVQAYKFGREGNIFQRISDITGLWFGKHNITLQNEFDLQALTSILSDLKKTIDTDAKPAEVTYNKGAVNVVKDSPGWFLDIDNNLKIVENHIKEENFVVQLELQELKPYITYEDVKDISTIVSSFTTYFNPADRNRTNNLAIASKKLDNYVILPGNTFSMDSALGPRTEDNGYLEAKIILKNRYVDSPGGGICQVTTTLYDAVLKAGLKIVQRTPHSMPSVYCDPGQDATIAEGIIDFKFKNDSDYAVCISTYLEGNHLTIRILGQKPEKNYTVKLKSEIFDEYPPTEVEYVVDDTVPIGQEVLSREAKNGCRAIVYRETYDANGKLIKREKISEDKYKPVQQQFKVNSVTYEKIGKDNT